MTKLTAMRAQALMRSNYSGPLKSKAAVGARASAQVFGKTDRKAQELEALLTALQQKDRECSSLSAKVVTATARVRTLETHVRDFKGDDNARVRKLQEKSSSDERVIESLKAEIAKLHKQSKPKVSKQSSYKETVHTIEP